MSFRSLYTESIDINKIERKPLDTISTGSHQQPVKNRQDDVDYILEDSQFLRNGENIYKDRTVNTNTNHVDEWNNEVESNGTSYSTNDEYNIIDPSYDVSLIIESNKDLQTKDIVISNCDVDQLGELPNYVYEQIMSGIYMGCDLYNTTIFNTGFHRIYTTFYNKLFSRT